MPDLYISDIACGAVYTFVAFAMSGTSQAVHEIESVKNFFKTRNSSANNDTLQASFADSLIMMIKNIKDFGPADAAMYGNALWGGLTPPTCCCWVGGVDPPRVQEPTAAAFWGG